MKITSFVSIIIISAIFCSCNYQKKLQEQLYFNDMIDSSHLVLTSFSATVKVDDRLQIIVSALNIEAAIPYNLSSSSSNSLATSSSASGGSAGGGYLVDKDGTILFPQLGKVQVEGKTLLEIRNDLLTSLSKYLTDPVVTVQFANARVLVMGEVGKPGPLPIPDGKLTILEAITLSGDIPFTGRKDNVLVIREENGRRIFAKVSLQSHNIYKSPYYFLRQNDLVYVQPTLQKIRQESNQVFLSNMVLITSITSILTSLFLLTTYLKSLK
jgi:polysaccharide export outer membrane protein